MLFEFFRRKGKSRGAPPEDFWHHKKVELQVFRKEPLPATALPKEPESIEANFIKLLDKLDFPESQNKRDGLLALNVDRKWLLIQAHNFDMERALSKGQKKIGLVKDTPQYYIHVLQTEPAYEHITGLRVAMGVQPVDWLKTYVELDGLTILLNLLAITEGKAKKTEDDMKIQAESLRCLKTFMNSELGLASVLDHMNGLRTISLCMDSQNWRIKNMVVRLMAAVCVSFEKNAHK